MSDTPKEAIPSETLRDWIMNPCRSKSEQEWWAAREIEKLERERDKATRKCQRLEREIKTIRNKANRFFKQVAETEAMRERWELCSNDLLYILKEHIEVLKKKTGLVIAGTDGFIGEFETLDKYQRDA